MQASIAKLCALIQQQPELCLHNTSYALFSNSTAYNASIPQTDPGYLTKCNYPLVNALNITFNFFAENVVYARVLQPAIIAGAFFCLSLAALAMLWKAKRSYENQTANSSARFGFAEKNQKPGTSRENGPHNKSVLDSSIH